MDNFYIKFGKRIKEIREQAGVSQQRLAVLLNISRPAISQIEKGERKISAEELKKLSEIFHIPIDSLLNFEKVPEITLERVKKEVKTKPQIRINVPQKNLKKFKEVFLYILNKVGAKPNIGETVIYKLLYFIDFNFYEKYEEQLIGATYIKNKFGPTPLEFTKIASKMVEDRDIVKVEKKYFEYPQTKYLPLRNPELSILKAHEIAVIDEVLNKLSEMNAAQISEYSHNDLPWLTAKDGDVIEYESVFYRTSPYSVREYVEDIR